MQNRLIFLISRSIFFFSIFLMCASALAQNTGYAIGYIVTNGGDTIQGLVKNKTAMPYKILQTIKFKATENGQVQHYEPGQLKGFMVGTQQYISMKFFTGKKQREAFMDVVVDGDMCFYEFNSTPIGKYKAAEVIRILKRKTEDTFFSVYGGHFKTRLSQYLHDDVVLSGLAAEGKFSENDMVDLVATYNAKKRMQRNPGRVETGEIFFFKPYRKHDQEFFLVVNDTLSYPVTETFKKRIKVPLGVNSRFCYGTANEKDCLSIVPKAAPAKIEYYILRANNSGTKFRIEYSNEREVTGLQFGTNE